MVVGALYREASRYCFMFRIGLLFSARHLSTKRIWSAFSFINRLRIAGDDKPAEVVRSRFMKLNADHIRFVLKCLAENSSPIRNMKQYLLASLYNAPTTMQLSYQNQTNHDLAMRR